MDVDVSKETLGFQSEVRQLLDLVINSLYSNKEVFLRELISNASDALDKLRFEALANDALYEGDSNLEIHVDYSKNLKTITIRDNGIGMSREEVVANLGTIARSGTREFFKALTGDRQKDTQLIGQFGVGFYSAFIVADRVTVTSRRVGLSEDEGVLWESDGKGEFSVQIVRKRSRGTEVVLHLKEDESELLDGFRLRDIIRKYSDHIAWPILMPREGSPGEERANSATALWTRAKKDITEEEYTEFYKHIGHDFEAPLAKAHNKVEGAQEYTTLFFVPAHAPFDLWDRDARHGVKLYVKRVFIMDDAEQLLPRYLRFVRGVVDSNDLPLNVSREILQHNRIIDAIRAASVKRLLGLFEDLGKDSETYAKFWKQFGRVLKEGLVEDVTNQERIARLLRFSSTHIDSEENSVSLDDYIARMQEGQEHIYYLTGDSFAAVRRSPHLEVFRQRGVEVLLMSDPIDEWVVTHLTEFGGKKLKSVAKGDLDLGRVRTPVDSPPSHEVGAYKDLLRRLRSILDSSVKDVRLSERLTASPACLVSEEHDLSPHLERILKAAGQEIGATKPILEINPEHPLILRLNDEHDSASFEDWARILFDQALLAEGGKLADPAAFVERLNQMLVKLTGSS